MTLRCDGGAYVLADDATRRALLTSTAPSMEIDGAPNQDDWLTVDTSPSDPCAALALRFDGGIGG